MCVVCVLCVCFVCVLCVSCNLLIGMSLIKNDCSWREGKSKWSTLPVRVQLAVRSLINGMRAPKVCHNKHALRVDIQISNEEVCMSEVAVVHALQGLKRVRIVKNCEQHEQGRMERPAVTA